MTNDYVRVAIFAPDIFVTFVIRHSDLIRPSGFVIRISPYNPRSHARTHA